MFEFDNVEQAFKSLDEAPFVGFGKSLSSYRECLMKAGFTRREAMRLVEQFAKYVYDLAFEDAMVAREITEHLDDYSGPDSDLDG